MNFHRFNNMDEAEQLEVFWNGVYIGDRSDGEFRIECRQVEDFYVEFKMIGGHYIDVRSFKSPDLLQPYFGPKWVNWNSKPSPHLKPRS